MNKILKDIERLSMEDGQNKDNARVTGFEGEHEAAKYIQSQFKKLGLNSELKTVDGIDGFIDEGSSLTINNQSITVKTLTYSQPTNQKLEGELVYAKTGTENECKEANLQGKIALIQRGSISFADKAKNAYNNGAVGVILYN
ncbi:PA domain-containing protein, partial [Clostridium tertium]